MLRRFPWKRTALPACFLVGLVLDAQSQPIRNPLIERPTRVVVERAERAFDSDALAAPLIRAAFSASGRKFELDLESNDRIKSGLDAEQQKRVANIRLYRGTLRNRPGSWVRLAERSGEIDGISIGGWSGASIELVVVDKTPLPPAPNPTPPPSPTPAPNPSPPGPAPATSSGGGGGAVDWMLALLLLAPAVLQARRLRRR